jgi:hypothetical protein
MLPNVLLVDESVAAAALRDVVPWKCAGSAWMPSCVVVELIVCEGCHISSVR